MTAIGGSAVFVVALAFGWPVVLAVGVVALVAVLCRPERWLLAVAMLACSVAGDLRGSTAASKVGEVVAASGPYQGELVGRPHRTPRHQNLHVEIESGARLCLQTGLHLDLGRGDVLLFDGTFEALARQAPSRLAALRQLGCAGTVAVGDLVVLRQGGGLLRSLDGRSEDITGWFGEKAPGDAGALLAGLVVGDDDGLSFDTRERFYLLGMSHITAVSGSNLALLTWLLIGRGGARRPLPVDALTLGALWLYVLVAGAGPSTVRAGLTATMCVAVVRLGRRPDLLTIACLVAAAQVAIDPALIENLGYRLSTIAMLVMISTFTGRTGRAWRHSVTMLVACTVAIQLATLPFTPNADQAVVAGVVANCLAAPVVALTFSLALAAALVRPASETVATALAVVAELPANAILGIVRMTEDSWLATVRPGKLGWLPQQVVRAGLVGLVVLALGRHSRRGIGDLAERVRALGKTEQGVWLALVAGAVMGATLVWLTR